jgi:formylglycine-generating enzyme required for sulfatase activity
MHFEFRSSDDLLMRSYQTCSNKNTTLKAMKKSDFVLPELIQAAVNNMIFLKGGRFMMGSDYEGGFLDEKPCHPVELNDFYICKFPVTQDLWQEVMGNNPSFFKAGLLPVECVSWYEAAEFIKSLNRLTGNAYRLPTEAEWEYAARGGNNDCCNKFSGSDCVHESGWFADNSDNTTHPVGAKKGNSYGIFDMNGNVYEWCCDWYQSDYYTCSPVKNPVGPLQGDCRVIRGGSWKSTPDFCRVTFRSRLHPNDSNSQTGFRLAHNAH